MPVVTVVIPTLLGDLVGTDRRAIPVAADDVGGALVAACAAHEQLRVHIFDATGSIRPHVTCLLDGVVVRDDLDRPVGEGDEIILLQAVSGG